MQKDVIDMDYVLFLKSNTSKTFKLTLVETRTIYFNVTGVLRLLMGTTRESTKLCRRKI